MRTKFYQQTIYFLEDTKNPGAYTYYLVNPHGKSFHVYLDINTSEVQLEEFSADLEYQQNCDDLAHLSKQSGNMRFLEIDRNAFMKVLQQAASRLYSTLGYIIEPNNTN